MKQGTAAGEAFELPQAVIFDCDGVLIDSLDASLYFYNSIREQLGLPPAPKEDEEYIFTATVQESLERLIPPELQSKAFEIASGFSISEVAERVRAMPGILDFLDFLSQKGIRTTVNTNSGREVHQILDAVGLSGHFEKVVTSDDVVRPKPNPEGALKILEFLDIHPAEVVYLGDSSVDEKTARGAALHFWAFKNPELNADFHVSSFPELVKAMSRAG